jgi:cardiolipin synthase
MAFPIFGRELNYRNHRKITVIDGKVGYIGGMNIGDEYRGHSEQLGYWRDTHMRLYGEGVMGLQHYFLMDWAFVSHQLLVDEDYLAIDHPDEEALVQVAASGPDTDWEIILQAYFTMIATAKTRIWITTPYLVPEDSVMSGLITAALSGVDVRIIIPSKPDHFLVYWATRANLENLLRSGVKIYTYEKGFIHSKTMIVDHGVASVGTANLDIRSLEINFEINAFLYGEKEIKQLSDDFEEDLCDSIQIEYVDYLQRSRGQRVLEAIGRLVSPLQ